MTAPRLAFADVSGGYGGTTVVRNLSGAADAGSVLCLLGRNGVGKTTLMKLLCGYLPPQGGSVRLDGRALDGLEPPRAIAPASPIARRSARCSTTCRCATISC